MLRLEIDKPEQAAANAPIRWCIGRDLHTSIKERGIEKAFLVVSVTSGEGENLRELSRKLLPLDGMLEWINFGGSGRHTIHAMVVGLMNASTANKRGLRKAALKKKTPRIYLSPLIDYEEGEFRTDWASFDGAAVVLESTTLDVVVDEELFAKEPSKFEKWYVNFWFETDPIDQCAFRRRRMLAYTVQPIPVFLWAFAKCFVRFWYALGLAVWGQRGVHWRPVFRPFDYGIDNVYDEYANNTNVFTHHANGRMREDALFLLHPLALLVYAGLITLGIYFGWWPVIAEIGFFGVIAAAIGGLFYKGMMFLVKRFPTWSKPFVVVSSWSKPFFARSKPLWRFIGRQIVKGLDRLEAWAERREKEARARERKVTLQQDAIVCTEAPLVPKLSALPPARRTIRLRFQELKARVCRPFAQ